MKTDLRLSKVKLFFRFLCSYCSNRIKNLFQLDIGDKHSWFSFTPSPDRPANFGPKNIQPMITRSFPGSQDARNYTPKQLSEFWNDTLISAASRNALQKFSGELTIPSIAHSGPDSFAYCEPRTDFYDFYVQIFLFIKFVIDITVLIFRYFELFTLQVIPRASPKPCPLLRTTVSLHPF